MVKHACLVLTKQDHVSLQKILNEDFETLVHHSKVRIKRFPCQRPYQKGYGRKLSENLSNILYKDSGTTAWR